MCYYTFPPGAPATTKGERRNATIASFVQARFLVVGSELDRRRTERLG
jgi:hypothetical protein